MASINTLNLLDLLSRKTQFCCLCLNNIEDDGIPIQDNASISLFNQLEIIEIISILTDVLGDEFTRNFTPLDIMCKQCMQLAIKCYTFIKVCKANFNFLSNTLNSLNNCLKYTHSTKLSSKSMIVALSTETFTCECYFDNSNLNSGNVKKLNTEIHKKRTKNQSSDKVDDGITNCDMRAEADTMSDFEHTTNQIKHKERNKKITISDMMHDKNDSVIKCKVCMKTWSKHSYLRIHYLRVHAPKNYKCPHCNKSYGSASLLKQHKYESHCQHVCSECGKTYNNRHSLKCHESSHRKRLICQACGRTYKTRHTYKKHIADNRCSQATRRSAYQGKFTCDICKKRFAHKTTLRVHITFEHGNGKSHICSWCNKKFYAQSRLGAHIVKHTQEKNFSCEQCGGRFVTKESLLYHTRIHTGERPYGCHLCEQRFLSSSRRSEHVRRHHSGLTFECEICHSKFKSKSSLQRHASKHFNANNTLIN